MDEFRKMLITYFIYRTRQLTSSDILQSQREYNERGQKNRMVDLIYWKFHVPNGDKTRFNEIDISSWLHIHTREKPIFCWYAFYWENDWFSSRCVFDVLFINASVFMFWNDHAGKERERGRALASFENRLFINKTSQSHSKLFYMYTEYTVGKNLDQRAKSIWIEPLTAYLTMMIKSR